MEFVSIKLSFGYSQVPPLHFTKIGGSNTTQTIKYKRLGEMSFWETLRITLSRWIYLILTTTQHKYCIVTQEIEYWRHNQHGAITLVEFQVNLDYVFEIFN